MLVGAVATDTSTSQQKLTFHSSDEKSFWLLTSTKVVKMLVTMTNSSAFQDHFPLCDLNMQSDYINLCKTNLAENSPKAKSNELLSSLHVSTTFSQLKLSLQWESDRISLNNISIPHQAHKWWE